MDLDFVSYTFCWQVNGRLVLEGALRIYWGVSGMIHLKEDDDQRTVVTVRKRNSYRYSGIAINGLPQKVFYCLGAI